MFLEQLHSEHNQAAEIGVALVLQALLVEGVDFGNLQRLLRRFLLFFVLRLRQHILRQLPVHGGGGQFVLCARDGAEDGGERRGRVKEVLVVEQRQFGGNAAQQEVAFRVVDEGEVLAQSNQGTVRAQQFGAKGVKGADGWWRHVGIEDLLQALLHFLGGFAREGEGEYMLGSDVQGVNEVCGASNQGAGFAAAWACYD